MGLFDRIKSFLGLTESAENGHSRDVSVTVERDVREDVDAESERAVKQPVDEGQAVEPDERAETGAQTDETAPDERADAGSESLIDEAEPEVEAEPETETESEVEAEPETETESEVEAEPETETESEVEAEPETETESEVEESDAGEATGASETDEQAGGTDLQAVKGIGPAYADRLESAGVTSVEELADADPEAIAAEIDVSDKQTARWIERARER
jgi:predicted flap endonuclease-1-like 5' DNA nuclease